MSIRRLIRWTRILLFLGLSLAGLIVAGMIGGFFVMAEDLPQIPRPLGRIIETPPTEIYASGGERLFILGGREAVPLSRVSPHFVEAVLATEDHRFWEHHGVDKLRTLKALWVTLFQQGRIQGASTITQQLAKNLFFSFERTYRRKFQELLVAFQIESQYPKEEILEAYVNQIPFGVGAYGIEQAARTFFGKGAMDLTLGEAALLAGLPKSPTRYNPYRHYERAKQRQKVVLSRMAAVGAITPEEARTAGRSPLNLNPRPAGTRTGSYYLDWIIQDLELRYGPEVIYHGGLKVTTTLDTRLQSLAEISVREGLEELNRQIGNPDDPKRDPGQAKGKSSEPQAALVAIEPRSGALRAMVGGRDYFESEYNRAVHHQRLPGSGFKPFLFYTAFEKLGLNPASVVLDRPVTIPVVGSRVWKPKNFERYHLGPMILKHALAESVNTVAAQLMEKVGPEAVIQVARRLGVTSPLAPVYSLALGTSGVSPLEMAAAFSVFAAGGFRNEPFWIRRVEDAYGRVLEEHITSADQVLDPRIAYQVLDMMQAVIEEGTGSIVRDFGFRRPAAGKTGTSDGYRDAWFNGFTPGLCTSVWVGYDRGKGLRTSQGRGITGGVGAGPIWARFMIGATAGEAVRQFSIPEDIYFARVNPITGLPAGAEDPNSMQVALLAEQELSGSGGMATSGLDR